MPPPFFPRWLVRLLLAGLLCAAISASGRAQQADKPVQPLPSPVTEQQIKAAIDRAVVHLRSRLNGLSGGQLAVTTMALLKAEVPADAPEIQAALDKITSRVSGGKFTPGNHHVYEAGVSIMALANADPKKYKSQIQAITDYLIARQGNSGEWDYPSPAAGDTSISQYGILGLWEASRAGIKIPSKVWDKAAAWHVSRQLNDGSFTYHPAGMNIGGGGSGTHTMTVAGIASLHVCRLHLYPDARDPDEPKAAKKKGSRKKFGVLEPSYGDSDDAAEPAVVDANFRPTTRLAAIDKAIENALKWISDRFAVTPPDTTWSMYYLYGLERMAALTKLREIAGHDWYAEGAALLVSLQGQGSGSIWVDSCGPEPATSFGILFLMRATEKMLGRKPRNDPRFGGGLLAGGRGLPENLNEVQLDKGDVKVRKLRGPVDELLAELENAQSKKVESAQAALVETILTENPEALIGQKDRLLKLSRDSRPEVRRTAYWALGRTNDLRIVSALIAGLSDADFSCMVEARNALNFVSKKIKPIELPDEPTPAQRASAIAQWKKWHLQVRPYDERDDLVEVPK